MTQFGTIPRGYPVKQKTLNPLGLTWAEMARAEGHRPGRPRLDKLDVSAQTSPMRDLIMDTIRETPGLTRKQYAEMLGVKPQTISNHMQRAREIGWRIRVEKVGFNESTYRITADADGRAVA